MVELVQNLVNGQLNDAAGAARLSVKNPASGAEIAQVVMSQKEHVGAAVDAGHEAFLSWRRVPVTERIQYLFKFKALLEEHYESIAEGITLECGKTINEARGELRRGIENVEVACGMPMMMQGHLNEDIARGIDEMMMRQPLGVVTAITPFNFPGMIPLWFMPYAVAAGNSFILKPSERVPNTTLKLVSLLQETGIPKGVVQLVNGGKEAVDALLEHPKVRAVSFVGSTPVARYIYQTAAKYGKRAQCQGGAKNPIIILPDADMEMTTRIAADSAFGCAGQRCLAASIAVTVGNAKKEFRERMVETVETRKVGFGLEESTQMGPVITKASQERIQGIVKAGIEKGATALVDGRNKGVAGYEGGYFLHPTLLDDVAPGSELAKTEIFGPVLSMMHVDTIDAAIDLVNAGSFGNMACLFTQNGAAARKFRNEANAGNIGINLGVAAPMAFFPFSGWKDSFFGDLHAQGRHAVEFYTETKVVIERWPSEWSRTF